MKDTTAEVNELTRSGAGLVDSAAAGFGPFAVVKMRQVTTTRWAFIVCFWYFNFSVIVDIPKRSYRGLR